MSIIILIKNKRNRIWQKKAKKNLSSGGGGMIGSEGFEQHCYYYCGEIISEQEIKNNQNKHDNILLLFLTNMIKAKNINILGFYLAGVGDRHLCSSNGYHTINV